MAGRYGTTSKHLRPLLLVSILARLNGRALLGNVGVHDKEYLVSILARLNGRALPGFDQPAESAAGHVSILARLNGRALPTTTLANTMAMDRFQSSPGLMAGRYR